MKRWGFTRCSGCETLLWRHIDATNLTCMKCLERENMPNIKLTAEVDGKQVPLETVSTETFEAIKALEKPKEIPVARLGSFAGSPRLIFKPTKDINLRFGRIYALDLRDGDLGAHWAAGPEDDESWVHQYNAKKVD